jgi:hypothetical protein
MAIDVEASTLKVRPIFSERGTFQAGAPIMEFAATKLLPDEGY